MTMTYRENKENEVKEVKEEKEEKDILGNDRLARILDTDTKTTAFIKKWFDYFDGGYGRSSSLDGNSNAIFVDKAHIVAGKIPWPSAVAEALRKLYISRARPDGFKYPGHIDFEKVGGNVSAVMTVLLQEACGIFRLTDENVRITLAKDYPVKLVGMESGIEILIAPRIETGD